MAGSITNAVVAHAQYPDGTDLEDVMTSCNTKTEAVDASKLQVSITSSSGSNDVKIGETIANYSIVVTNNCNVTLSNITVSDTLSKTDGRISTFKIAELEPGHTSEIFTTLPYIVSATDIPQGSDKIINTAKAEGEYTKSTSDDPKVVSDPAQA